MFLGDNSPEIEQYKTISTETLKYGGIFQACNFLKKQRRKIPTLVHTDYGYISMYEVMDVQ